MDEPSRSYIAGLFDGEGSVSLIHQKQANGNMHHVLNVNIVNTNRECLDYVVLKIGFGRVSNRVYKRSNGEKAAIFKFEIRSQQANRFLKDIYPRLIIKKSRVEIALQFQKELEKLSNPHHDRSALFPYCQKLRDLNHYVGSAKALTQCKMQRTSNN